MYPISNAVKALFEAEQRQVLRITGTDKNGTAINITDADVVIDSFNIDRFSCIGNKLEIGTATSAQMTVKLDNYDGRFNGIVFEGTADAQSSPQTFYRSYITGCLIRNFAGGGITPDSVALDEWEETEIKASTLLNLIKIAK